MVNPFTLKDLPKRRFLLALFMNHLRNIGKKKVEKNLRKLDETMKRRREKDKFQIINIISVGFIYHCIMNSLSKSFS